MKDAWRATQRSWKTIGAGDVVKYDNCVSLAYACGTTPIHVCLYYELLQSHLRYLQRGMVASRGVGHRVRCVCVVVASNSTRLSLEKRRAKIIALCGGSGAELIGAAILCQDWMAAQIGCGRLPVEAKFELEVVTVDHAEDWGPRCVGRVVMCVCGPALFVTCDGLVFLYAACVHLWRYCKPHATM